MPTFSQVQLQRGRGLTFAEIGEMFGVSRQRVHSIFTGYMRAYKKTDKYREWTKHYTSHIQPIKDCNYCESENNYSHVDLKQYHAKWYINHPDAKKAHRMISKAIEMGEIIRPQVCTRCKKAGKIQGHHEDYSKPLDVLWLCVSCHRLLHSGMLHVNPIADYF